MLLDRPSPDAKSLLGWVLLGQSQEEDGLALTGEDPLAESLQAFEEVLEADPGHLDAALGRAHSLTALGRKPEALALLADVLARASWFVPAAEYRAEALAADGE